MKSAASKLKLYYFTCYGRAEPIRILLHQAKVDFEDIRFEYADFNKLKEEMGDKLEFGQAPVIVTPEGESYSQSQSILRLLGKQHGFYPEDNVAAWKVDSTLDANRDLQEKFWDVQMAGYKQLGEEKTQELLNEYAVKFLPNYLRVMQKRLIKNGSDKFMVGDAVTLADIDNAHIAYTYLLNDMN